MRHTLLFMILLLASTAHAHADCFADYKAKQDDPLRLHYGIAEIRGECSKAQAARELDARLRSQGWQLLNVLDVFDAAGLDERRGSAGEFFLRF